MASGEGWNVPRASRGAPTGRPRIVFADEGSAEDLNLEAGSCGGSRGGSRRRGLSGRHTAGAAVRFAAATIPGGEGKVVARSAGGVRDLGAAIIVNRAPFAAGAVHARGGLRGRHAAGGTVSLVTGIADRGKVGEREGVAGSAGGVRDLGTAVAVVAAPLAAGARHAGVRLGPRGRDEREESDDAAQPFLERMHRIDWYGGLTPPPRTSFRNQFSITRRLSR